MGVDRDVGAAREGRQLQLGELQHHAMRRGQLGQALDERDADVAAQHDRGLAGAEHGRDQRAGGGLALGAGDADGGGRTEAQEEVDLADHRDAGRRASTAASAAAQARLGGREAAADRRRGADQGLARERSAPGPPPGPAAAGAGAPRGPRWPRASCVGRASVVDRDLGTVVGQEAGQREAAAGQAQHGHGLAPEGLQVQVAQVDGRGRRCRHRRQLSSPTVAM